MSHKIELIPSGIPGARPSMYRGGQRFNVGEARILELTDEELELFKNDARFKISNSKDPGTTLAEAALAEGTPLPPTSGSIEAKIAPAEVEAATAEVVAPQEEANAAAETSEGTETLLKDFSRDELNAQAKKAGVKKPEKLGSKTEVAQAIIDAQG